MKRRIAAVISCLVIAAALAAGLVPSIIRSASCADCDIDNAAGLKRAFETFDENCRKHLGDGNARKTDCFAPGVYNKVLPIMKALSKDNRFGPGERLLVVGDTQSGNLAAGASRSFQTVAPVDKDTLSVEVEKTDGENGAFIKICSVDETGSARRLATIKFDTGQATGRRSASLTGMQGKMVRIDVAGFGQVPRKFQYTIRTN